MKRTSFFLFVVSVVSVLYAEEPAFTSTLFEAGTLVYSDEFDNAMDKRWWKPRTKSWDVKDGVLIGRPDHENAEAAKKALGRDHHLGLSPVIRFDNLPEKFVLQLRVKFEGTEFAVGRPKFDIGHHINTVVFNAEGYSVKLHGGEQFVGKAPKVKLNDWIDIVLEFEEGKMWIAVNGSGQTIKHEQVSLKGRSELTFKTFAAAPNRILFDSAKLWQAK